MTPVMTGQPLIRHNALAHLSLVYTFCYGVYTNMTTIIIIIIIIIIIPTDSCCWSFYGNNATQGAVTPAT